MTEERCCGTKVEVILGPKYPVTSLPDPPRTTKKFIQYYRWQCMITYSHRGESYLLLDK